jgi:hypothetical protein
VVRPSQSLARKGWAALLATNTSNRAQALFKIVYLIARSVFVVDRSAAFAFAI